MTNAIKALLQMTSVSLQPVPSLGGIKIRLLLRLALKASFTSYISKISSLPEIPCSQ
jgi:hypothetical protein